MLKIDPIKTISIFGPVSSGKTHLIATVLADKPDVLVMDTTFEIEDDNYEHVWKNPQEVLRIVKSPGSHRIVYHPGRNLHESFKWCSEIYWQLDQTRWIVLDECHEYAEHENFDSLVRYSRKRGLGVICASQRIADVPKSLTANSRMVIMFSSMEARDYIAVKDRFGVEMADRMRNLRPLIYNDETKITEQTPEVLVYTKGKGVSIHDLGSGEEKLVTSQLRTNVQIDSANSVENSSSDMN